MFYISTFGDLTDINSIVKYYGVDIIAVYDSRTQAYENIKNKIFIETPEDLLSLGLEKRTLVLAERTDLSKLLDFFASKGFPAVVITANSEYLPENLNLEPLPPKFFQRGAKQVAIELLGKLLVKKEIDGTLLIGKIVETEAYYGTNDPASRAYRGLKKHNKGMWLDGGHIFTYMVHANWMFNITTDHDDPEAVLIRALEPLAGLKVMYSRRRRKKIKELCSGPGKLSAAFGIDISYNEKELGNDLFIAQSPYTNFEIGSSHRIGVSADVEEHLRFFIKGNRFVSR